MLEFLARNGIDWAPRSTEETVRAIEGVAAGEISEREFAGWLRSSRPEELTAREPPSPTDLLV
jgi:prophage maintenance system killer protein